MPFPLITQKIATLSLDMGAGGTNAMGTQQTVNIPTNDFLEEITIRVKGTTGATVTTPNADFFLAILQRLEFIPGTPDKQSTVDIPGARLIDYQIQTLGAVDPATNTAYSGLAAATSYTAYYRIPCAPFNVDDPIRSSMLVPVWRFGTTPQLRITIATAAQMASVFTFGASSILSIELWTRKRLVPDSVKNMPTFPTDLTSTALIYAATGSLIPQQLPTPGAYMNMMWCMFTAAGAASDITSSAACQIQLGTTQPYNFDMPQLWALNVDTFAFYTGRLSTSPVAPMLDLVSDRVGSSAGALGSIFDTSASVKNGVYPTFITNIAAVGTIYFVAHRIYNYVGPVGP